MSSTMLPAQTAVRGPKLGLTLYSLTNEWVAGLYDLDSLIARVAADDLGPGVEIVGFQSIKGFPDVSDEFVRHFRGLLDRYDLQPSCLGSNIDVALRSDRFLETDESVAYLSRQIDTARKIGFPVVRVQMGATPAVIEKITPYAEKAGIKLGMEIHAPEGPTTPSVMAVRDTYAKLGSPNLGFIPDFSSTMHSVPKGMLASYVKAGLPQDLADRLGEGWKANTPPFQRFTEFAELARGRGVDDEVINQVMLTFTMFGHEDVDSWTEIAPQIFHVHGKCYEFDQQGMEPSISYDRLIPLLVKAGFDGYISTEWEGHGWLDATDVDAFTLVRKHHDMVQRLIDAELAA